MSSPLSSQSSSSCSPSTRFLSSLTTGSKQSANDDDDGDDDDNLTAAHAPSSVIKSSLTRARLGRRFAEHRSPRQMLTPGPLGLSRSSGNEAGTSESARLIKQQFRLKCQEAMAKDRKRDRDRKVAQGRGYSGVPDADSDEEDGKGKRKMVLCSDDLSSSDVDEATMDEQEIEMARRILAGDYKRMLRELERNGQMELGWLDPDEVAWLEEEVRREEANMGMYGVEPPADMLDEDEELYAQFQHSQSTHKGTDFEEGSDDDFSWVKEDEWERAVDEASTITRRGGERPAEDTIMGDM